MECSIECIPSTPPPPEIAEIVRRKKTQYCELADKGLWTRLTEVITPNARIELCNADGSLIEVQGTKWEFTRDEFIAYSDAAFKEAQCVHLMGPGIMGYEPASGSTPAKVKVVWNCIYHVGAKGDTGPWNTGGGYYHETWVQQGNTWQMDQLKFLRSFWKTSAAP